MQHTLTAITRMVYGQSEVQGRVSAGKSAV